MTIGGAAGSRSVKGSPKRAAHSSRNGRGHCTQRIAWSSGGDVGTGRQAVGATGGRLGARRLCRQRLDQRALDRASWPGASRCDRPFSSSITRTIRPKWLGNA